MPSITNDEGPRKICCYAFFVDTRALASLQAGTISPFLTGLALDKITRASIAGALLSVTITATVVYTPPWCDAAS